MNSLNPQQLEAVHHTEGPLLILAGAGSGKTRVITHRIAHLIRECHVSPGNILAVTFTNKAAGEMRERVERLLHLPSQGLWISTFHSACLRILRQSIEALGFSRDFVIYDDDEQQTLLKQCLKEFDFNDKAFPVRGVAARINAAKNELIGPNAFPTADFFSERVQKIYALYQEKLRRNQALDFGDLIRCCVELFRKHPAVLSEYQRRFRYILIDEYQDTNHAQYHWVKLLAASHQNLCVVGDEDQCLVGSTLVTMADGSKRFIKEIRIGDSVLSGYGSGEFRSARVTDVFKKHIRSEGILILMRSGRRLMSTPEHTHFAGYCLGAVPQAYFTYAMYKKAVGWRLGTTQVYTAGQKKPMVGFKQRLLQEHADALWVIGTHSSENEARAEEYILSLKYQIPTLPFVPRKGGSRNGLVHDQNYLSRVFASLNTELGARRLLADRGLSIDHPHHRPRSRNSSRRNVVVTLCGDRRGRSPMHLLSIVGNDEEGRKKLKKFGFSVRSAKKGSSSWRVETANKDFGWIDQMLRKLRKAFDTHIFFVARLGANHRKVEGNSLPFLPAASVQPGMAMFSEGGSYDIVEKVERVKLNEVVYDLNIERVHNFVANGIVTHNSIYRWRGAQIDNILNFERDYLGTKLIKLEQNYRSTQTILSLATRVVERNQSRKGKVLWTAQPGGEPGLVYAAQDEREEASFVVARILDLAQKGVRYDHCAIFYRTNAQSRSFEEELRRHRIPYVIYGGMKFYERKEIKDVLAYLRLLVHPEDSLAFFRVLNVPPRGIGAKTIEILTAEANRLGVSPLVLIQKQETLQVLALNAGMRQRLGEFGLMCRQLSAKLGETPLEAMPLADFVAELLKLTGYRALLEKEGTVEAENRLENLDEFLNVVTEFEKEQRGLGSKIGSRQLLQQFFDEVALVGATDSYDPEKGAVPLMTLHLAKGLEFPYVFLVGMEEGLFPHNRSLDEPEELEEERRLCYVGITRAMQRVHFSHAMRRYTYGGEQYNLPSRFLDELPSELTVREGLGKKDEAVGVQNFEPLPNYDHFEEARFGQATAVKIGTRVRHALFGAGVIRRKEGVGENQKVTICFEDGRMKVLMLKYANLDLL